MWGNSPLFLKSLKCLLTIIWSNSNPKHFINVSGKMWIICELKIKCLSCFPSGNFRKNLTDMYSLILKILHEQVHLRTFTLCLCKHQKIWLRTAVLHSNRAQNLLDSSVSNGPTKGTDGPSRTYVFQFQFQFLWVSVATKNVYKKLNKTKR